MASRAFSFSDVLRALGGPETRSYAVNRFREQGILAASGMQLLKPWATSKVDTCRALTATEDWLEINHPKRPERVAIRNVRRALEGAL